MAVTPGMFLFEVVVEKVNSLVDSRHLIIRSEFADIFSLELVDPKMMHIVMPEPLPLPPEPVGKKKGKKKPKPKKRKKGKKGVVQLPPPEPKIQSGQSVLFASSAEILMQCMKHPLVLSLWTKEENLTYIGSISIPWDPVFILYLQKISDSVEVPPVSLKDDYNIFEENTAKIMAKVTLQVRLSYLAEKVTTAFRAMSEDPNSRKYLYTGLNSKTTSFMCTMKTTDEVFIENCNKIENKYIVDKPETKPTAKGIVYADYKNAPGANLSFFSEKDFCCLNYADKPPDSIYKAPETCPDINFIIDYIRKIIVSCNDNLRMLTPRPTIKPRIKATDIDRLCYCKETAWPDGELAQRFKKDVQSGPCPICIDAGQISEGRGTTFDIANIRGPCGKADCKIARDMRAYIENLVDEDNIEFDISEIVGPCGSKDCTLADKIQDFICHKGAFKEGQTLEGLSTQCACLEKMQETLTKRASCTSVCSKDCELTGSDASHCGGPSCPYPNNEKNKVYDVYYFTIEHDFDMAGSPSDSSKTSKASKPSNSPKTSLTSKSEATKSELTESIVPTASDKSSKFRYCSSTCPSVRTFAKASCSKTTCSTNFSKKDDKNYDVECIAPVCPFKKQFPPSPADSSIIMDFDEINNPCCVKSCDIAQQVKDFIEEGVLKEGQRKKVRELEDACDSCYCDCVCNFNFSNKTTYCAICAGYECLGDDVKDLPAFRKPHPCPVYHKLYDKNVIQVKSPWPHEDKSETKKESLKISKANPKGAEKTVSSDKAKKTDTEPEDETEKVEKKKQPKHIKKIKPSKDTKPVETPARVEKKPEVKYGYPYPSVPKNMGWNWVAEDIPGMKPRPKWRPGAAHKLLVRKYRSLREGTDTIAKKRRAMMQRKKKLEAKPTLVVTKRNGDYTVSMEVFKKYSKERLPFQYPYEEKPPLVYIIGKTQEEQETRQKKHDRRVRRETRRKSRLLQSTFRDKCQEICVKAYNQALGLQTLPNPNDPECPCYTNPNPELTPPIDSCSCSDDGTISTSDTDNDEWVIEFTPPLAKWDGKAKHLPPITHSETQYTYLDYRVKIFDKNGNPVPRFFKSHEGKQECSDLGGFWGPDKKWLEINKDGYIGPDERWVPMNFHGPDGMLHSAEDGFFTDSSGVPWKIGVDGYVDKDLKWVFYKKKPMKSGKTSGVASSMVDTKQDQKTPNAAETPRASKTDKSKAPATSNTSKANAPPAGDKDKKVTTAPLPASATKKPVKQNPVVMSLSVNYNNKSRPSKFQKEHLPLINTNTLLKYHEILEGLDAYEPKPTLKTNRACNTIGKNTWSVFKSRQSSGILKYYTQSKGQVDSTPESASTHGTNCYHRYR